MNTLNSAGESNSDESMDQMEIMDKIIESDEDEPIPNCSPENFVKPSLMLNQIFTSDPKVKAKIHYLFIELEILIFQELLLILTYSTYPTALSMIII